MGGSIFDLCGGFVAMGVEVVMEDLQLVLKAVVV